MVTQQFHETLEPLSEWLAATEKHLANSEPTGTETSKLEDQISQHKVISIILQYIITTRFFYDTVSYVQLNSVSSIFACYFQFVLFIISHSVFH